MSYFIAGVLILGLTFLLLRKRVSGSASPRRQAWSATTVQQDGRSPQAAHSGIALPATREMLAEEESAMRETFALLESRMNASGVFVPEKISVLLSLLRTASQPFSRVNKSVAFQGDTVLTVAEKKALNLNTRMRYTREYLAFFLPERLAGLEPKSLLSDMHLAAFHEVRNRRELAKLKRSGLIRRVGILACDDGRDCTQVRSVRRTFALDEAPALPLPGCDAPYCRCLYTPIVDADRRR